MTMRRSIFGYLLILLLMIAAISACSKKDKDDMDKNNNITGKAGITVTPTTGTEENTDISPTTAAVNYQYEHDLNIIDDNYRNYYEIFVASYCDSNNDGKGDLGGIISKLDYISDMGFNGIWLMPIMPSPSYHKYDVADYYSVDPSYGTLDDFKNLVKECHARGIKLIIDFVLNHSSAQNPWFTQATEYLQTLGKDGKPDLGECPYVGYYNFSNEKKSSKYYPVGSSGWYYEAQFSSQMPDLKLDSADVKAEIQKFTKFWLDMGVDGFRLDAIKDYFTGDVDKNVDFLKWFDSYVQSINPNAYIVGECWDNYSVVDSYYKSGITSLFDYPVALLNGVIVPSVRKLNGQNAKSFVKSITDLNDRYKAVNPNYIDAPFISNHDNPRAAMMGALDPNLIKMDAGVLLTLNGSPFVYYGDEIGMGSQGNKDENKRLPMNWSATDKTGMTTPPPGADAVVQKLPPLDEQQKDPLSILNYYKRALRIRNENPEIARGEFNAVDALTTESVCAFKKVYQGSEIVIVYNMNKEAATVDLNSADLGSLGIRGYLTVDGSEVTLAEGKLNMPQYSIVVLK